MASLRMKVTASTMLPTPEFFAVVKAVERFYYALLFSTDAEYSGRPDPWRSWVEQGFSAAIRQPPPETRKLDSLVTSVRSDGKVIELTATSVNDTLLAEVADLLDAVSADQSANPGDGPDDRPPFEMEVSSGLRRGLVEPVSAALTSSGVDKRTSERIMEMLLAAIRALMYKDIVSIAPSVTTGVDPQVSGATS
jgi:hypothetical protein